MVQAVHLLPRITFMVGDDSGDGSVGAVRAEGLPVAKAAGPEQMISVWLAGGLAFVYFGATFSGNQWLFLDLLRNLS